MSHHKLILWDPIKNEWRDNGGFCALSKEFVMTKWGCYFDTACNNYHFYGEEREQSYVVRWSMLRFKIRKSPARKVWGWISFLREAFDNKRRSFKKYILRNSVAISSNRRNESMNHDQWMKYVYDTLKQTSSVPWCRHSNICHSYKILGHCTCHRCCYQR